MLSFSNEDDIYIYRFTAQVTYLIYEELISGLYDLVVALGGSNLRCFIVSSDNVEVLLPAHTVLVDMLFTTAFLSLRLQIGSGGLLVVLFYTSCG